MSPEMSTPRQSKKLPGMIAPRNKSSSETPVKIATIAMSNQFRGVRICLLERSVACLNSGQFRNKVKRNVVTVAAAPTSTPALLQLPRPEGKRPANSESSSSSVPSTVGAFANAYALKNNARIPIVKLVPRQDVIIAFLDTYGRSSILPLPAAARGSCPDCAGDGTGLPCTDLLLLLLLGWGPEAFEDRKPVCGFHSGNGGVPSLNRPSSPSSAQDHAPCLPTSFTLLGLGTKTG
mmetsp:Transcript_14098/g.38100  ORF Transcript_14098/g.38100 Transcript_14098/m.38100 type:complete len:235 (+) Transcript_14098:469-1173(+)